MGRFLCYAECEGGTVWKEQIFKFVTCVMGSAIETVQRDVLGHDISGAIHASSGTCGVWCVSH